MKRILLPAMVFLFGITTFAQQRDVSLANSNVKSKTGDPRSAYKNYIDLEIPDFVVETLPQLASDGGQTLEALNIRDFSKAMPNGANVIADAHVVGSEDTARGTNVAPAIMAAMAAAKKGQFVIIGPGDWVVSTPLQLPASKQTMVICMGNLHFNKRDGFRIVPPVGAPPQHKLYIYGALVGRENMAKHLKSTHDNGTEPKWAEMTNTGVDITNCDRNYVLINKAEGFGNAVRINGGGGLGCQENTVSFQLFYKNANGIVLRSTDGNSYVDKNHFYGFNGGASRISGGLAIKIDGFEGAAPNGEPYNGAFRSNEFHVMIEQVDSIMRANGDITEPVFDITVEAGVNTGVFGNMGFQMRSVKPNFVRTPKYCGAGILNTQWMTQGMGVNGNIMGMPVYYNSKVLLGTMGKTDENGNVVMEAWGPIQKYVKDALPPSIKIINEPPKGSK